MTDNITESEYSSSDNYSLSNHGFTLEKLKQQYDIVSIVDLNPWHDLIESDRKTWFRTTLDAIYKPVYQDKSVIGFAVLPKAVEILSRENYQDTPIKMGS